MKKYVDKYGQFWRRPQIEAHKYVYRIPDGCVGVWDNGRGLVPLLEPASH